MKIPFTNIEEAFMFVSSGRRYENSAMLSLKTGQAYYQSTYIGDDELPDDLDEDNLIEIPHKNELNLGRDLALRFTYRYLADQAEDVEQFFRSRGAYAKFTRLLERLGKLELWYAYEEEAQRQALLTWCRDNDIPLEEE